MDAKHSFVLLASTALVLLLLPTHPAQAQGGGGGAPEFGGGEGRPQWGQGQPQWGQGEAQGRPPRFVPITDLTNSSILQVADFSINTFNVSNNASLTLSSVLEAATARQQDGSIFRVAFSAIDAKLQPPLSRVFRADVFQSLAGWSRLIIFKPVLFFENN